VLVSETGRIEERAPIRSFRYFRSILNYNYSIGNKRSLVKFRSGKRTQFNTTADVVPLGRIVLQKEYILASTFVENFGRTGAEKVKYL